MRREGRMTRAFECPTDKKTPRGDGRGARGDTKETALYYNGNNAQVIPLRRSCASCGVPFYPDHPKHDLCAGCHQFFRVRWLKDERAALARATR
jgi:ribosomal protein S27AE